MRNFKRHKIGILGAVLLSFGLYSCSTEEQTAELSQSIVDTKAMNGDQVAIPEVQLYYDNLKTIVFATEINRLQVAESFLEDEVSLVEKLKNIHIIDEETDKQLSFYDMEELYQVSFIDQYMDEAAITVSNKVRLVPELTKYFSLQNGIVKTLLQENLVTSIETKVKDRKKFFEDLNIRIGEIQISNPPVVNLPTPTVPDVNAATKTRNLLASMNAQRGDILVGLPKHGFKFQLLATDNKRFAVGHTGIVTANITAATLTNSLVFVEAWRTGGIQKKAIQNAWDESNFYLMELKEKRTKVKFTWKKGVHTTTSYHPINKNSFAAKGESFIGKKYLYNVDEFLHMKATARILNRFVCSSHVWFAAKNSVSVNLSNPLSQIVTPSDVYSDSESFVKGEIKNKP